MDPQIQIRIKMSWILNTVHRTLLQAGVCPRIRIRIRIKMSWIRNAAHGTLLQAGVCPFFLRGYCKFGRRCHKRHVQPEKAARVDDDHLTGQWKIQRVRGLKGQSYETIATFDRAVENSES
jgi:hypothetical protein